jgi:hypothetical protein
MSGPIVAPMSGPRSPALAWGLFFGGWVLVAIGFFLVAVEEYDLFSSAPTISNFNQVELYLGAQSICVAVGVMAVGVGWVLSWPPIPSTGGAPGLPTPSPRSVWSYVALFVGVGCIAGVNLYYAYLELAVYYQVTLSVWKWTEVTLEILQGLGVLLAAFGWLIHRVNDRSLAASSPRFGGP